MKQLQNKSNLKCVKCGRGKPGGGWISVNVYDRVIGRGKGVECGRKDCKPKEGTPYAHKMFWYKHFFTVISRPDYFTRYVYNGFWNTLIDELPVKIAGTRAVKIKEMIENKYLKRKKWWQFWK